MNRRSRPARSHWILAVLVALSVPTEAAKKFKDRPRKGEASHYFVNRESEEVSGLVVHLSKKATVITDPSTGFVGPFQNIRGQNTKSITLSNARPPVAPASDNEAGFDLVFRSYKAGLKIKSYYWIDADGKRVGGKHSP